MALIFSLLSMDQASFLSLEQVAEILPDNLKFSASDKIERSIYRSSNGKPLAIVNSKLYPDGTYWFSCVTKYFKDKGVESICFVCANSGVILVSTDAVLAYNKASGWKELRKGRSYYVRIRVVEGKHILFNFNDSSFDIDASDGFIPYTF